MGSAGHARRLRCRADSRRTAIDAVDDDEQDDARHDRARCGNADGAGARLRLQSAQAADAGDQDREHRTSWRSPPAGPSRRPGCRPRAGTSGSGMLKLIIVSAPPRMPTRSANSVSSGTISTAARMRVTTRKRTGSSPIVVSAFNFLVDLHRADLRGERRAGAPGEQDRRHQRSQLAQDRQADQVGDEDLGAELAHRHRRLEREDDARAGTRSARRSATRSTPTCSQVYQTSFQRTLASDCGSRTTARSWSRRQTRSASRCRASVISAARPISSTACRRSSGFGCGRPQRDRIELIEQRLELGLEPADGHRRAARIVPGAGDRRAWRRRRHRSSRRAPHR